MAANFMAAPNLGSLLSNLGSLSNIGNAANAIAPLANVLTGSGGGGGLGGGAGGLGNMMQSLVSGLSGSQGSSGLGTSGLGAAAANILAAPTAVNNTMVPSTNPLGLQAVGAPASAFVAPVNGQQAVATFAPAVANGVPSTLTTVANPQTGAAVAAVAPASPLANISQTLQGANQVITEGSNTLQNLLGAFRGLAGAARGPGFETGFESGYGEGMVDVSDTLLVADMAVPEAKSGKSHKNKNKAKSSKSRKH